MFINRRGPPLHEVIIDSARSLFSTPFNAFLSIISLTFIFLVVPPLANWMIFDAVWVGGAEACAANPNAACWSFIAIRWPQFLYGFYEETERWRANLVMSVFFIGIILMLIPRMPRRSLIAIFMLTAFPVLAWLFLYGGFFGLEIVSTSMWGGFMLTLVIAVFGMVISLPFGILLALARRADRMPVLQSFSIIFIEFWRGIPLITVLFMALVMFPLFLPKGAHFDQLLRAMIGFAFFSSAYMAEVIRGGLQGVDKGQYEAVDALGFSYWKGMRLVVLPQALQTVIPGIVNTFIGLFKDTTLVLIIGLFDFVGMIQAAILSPKWSIKSVAFSGYTFAALVFFCFCFAMSSYSRSLERKLSVGKKY